MVFEALADDTRRRIVEVLADGERSAGELAALFEISRPGVSRHLRLLREAGLVEVTPDAQRRMYALVPEPLDDLVRWLGDRRSAWAAWAQRLDSLETEIARGRKGRAKATSGSPRQPRQSDSSEGRAS